MTASSRHAARMARNADSHRNFAPIPPSAHRDADGTSVPGTKPWRRPMRSRITCYSLAFALAVLPLPAGLSSAMARPTVEVAFVLDTTGSMSQLIEGAKRKIWSIATAIVDSNPDADIRMGLVAYRDIGDDYVT